MIRWQLKRTKVFFVRTDQLAPVRLHPGVAPAIPAARVLPAGAVTARLRRPEPVDVAECLHITPRAELKVRFKPLLPRGQTAAMVRDT
jgi:hypothetical protein